MTSAQIFRGDRVIVSHLLGDEPGTAVNVYDPGLGTLITVRFDDRTQYVFSAADVRLAEAS